MSNSHQKTTGIHSYGWLPDYGLSRHSGGFDYVASLRLCRLGSGDRVQRGLRDVGVGQLEDVFAALYPLDRDSGRES